jgi:hypothetical protein
LGHFYQVEAEVQMNLAEEVVVVKKALSISAKS